MFIQWNYRFKLQICTPTLPFNRFAFNSSLKVVSYGNTTRNEKLTSSPEAMMILSPLRWKESVGSGENFSCWYCSCVKDLFYAMMSLWLKVLEARIRNTSYDSDDAEQLWQSNKHSSMCSRFTSPECFWRIQRSLWQTPEPCKYIMLDWRCGFCSIPNIFLTEVMCRSCTSKGLWGGWVFVMFSKTYNSIKDLHQADELHPQDYA